MPDSPETRLKLREQRESIADLLERQIDHNFRNGRLQARTILQPLADRIRRGAFPNYGDDGLTYSAKILADSVYPGGTRLTTMEVVFPRPVLAELNTHRMFSRNSASSRAIPVSKILARANRNPYVPTAWGVNQKGMQASKYADEETAEAAASVWLRVRDAAVHGARTLLTSNIHKQTTNRLLEPFMWHTAIISATEWSNFFNLRDSDQADPALAVPAKLMREAWHASKPTVLQAGEWHLPLTTEEERRTINLTALIKICIGRCARVSYLTHDGERDLDADIQLYDRLLTAGHMSPFEHAARPATVHDTSICLVNPADIATGGWVPPHCQWHGNFLGWVQRRKQITGEADMHAYRKETV